MFFHTLHKITKDFYVSVAVLLKAHQLMNKQRRAELIIGFVEREVMEEPILIHTFMREFSESYPQYAFKSVKSAAQILKDISVVNKNVEFNTKIQVSTVCYKKVPEKEIVIRKEIA